MAKILNSKANFQKKKFFISLKNYFIQSDLYRLKALSIMVFILSKSVNRVKQEVYQSKSIFIPIDENQFSQSKKVKILLFRQATYSDQD